MSLHMEFFFFEGIPNLIVQTITQNIMYIMDFQISKVTADWVQIRQNGHLKSEWTQGYSVLTPSQGTYHLQLLQRICIPNDDNLCIKYGDKHG